MKKTLKNIFTGITQRYICALFVVVPVFYSCIDTEPKEVLDYKYAYNDLNAADAAIRGLYGQFMTLVDKVIVLNELRADLMDVTNYATTDLQEINISRPSKGNVWADVTPFYNLVQNCNDILFNFDEMLKDNRFSKPEYDERYSDVAALRTWIYLQLGIHFGRVPYITQPIITLSDLDKAGTELDLNALITELISCMENLPTLENYRNSPLVQNRVDGYSLIPMFINKKLLLADLYLFDDQYEKAAVLYRTIMGIYEHLGGGNNSADRTYHVCIEESWSKGVNPWCYAVLLDYNNVADNFVYNAWREMFAGTSTSSRALNEMIWFFNYDMKFLPEYSLRKLFDLPADNGKYQIKPSKYAVNNLWGAETQINGLGFDARGLTGGFDETDYGYRIRKFSYFSQFPAGDTKGGWYLYRAGMLHLRYAEAANRAGYLKVAWAIVNDGIYGSSFRFRRPDGSSYTGDSILVSGDNPQNPYPFPYNFDARYTDSPIRIRGSWRQNNGIRGRANLPAVAFPAECITKRDSMLFLEKFIIRESALELGFEGHRWEDLIRVSRRLNKENAGSGDRFLWDENLAKKYEKIGGGADLSSSDKWFLPLYK